MSATGGATVPSIDFIKTIIENDNPPLGVMRSLLYNPGLSVVWTPQEQAVLDELLLKYAPIYDLLECYALISNSLENKTIRDVALRCKWMSYQNRMEDIWFMCPSNGSSNTQFAENDEMSEINEPAKQILEGNSQSLNQISANLAGYQIDRNMNLFSKVRENIYHLWHQSNDPRFMQRMPDLDYVDDQLFAFLDGPLSVYNPY
ncbi:uncharacterized protein LOC127259923 isoform X2 [Andrographis paniculata]|uniref:uncharacterized protein LOC127259923 isoform X2 n=1 Tax=Andrographis paniculata TaxID=175694 RepID=UPI0021E7A50B|nr:uncharacterized protein LOC127259923 isoform X2 [Andrographis paniculata]